VSALFERLKKLWKIRLDRLRQELQRGSQQGAKQGVLRGKQAGDCKKISLQIKLSAAVLAAVPGGKHEKLRTKQDKHISMMVELVTHVLQNAPLFLMMNSKLALFVRIADRG
jgi:hypothetical protein